MGAVESNQVVVIDDAYTDPRFDRQIDQKSGFLTRSVISMPIMGHGSSSVGQTNCCGVLQMINKLPAGSFDDTDVELLNLFGTYCSIMVNYKNLHEASVKYVSLLFIYIFDFAALDLFRYIGNNWFWS